MSRRAADVAIAAGRVRINGAVVATGVAAASTDKVELDNRPLNLPTYRTIMLHKPVGYVTSRRQQGATPTLYALLPEELQPLKPVGRLDKDSSGLLLLTNDGSLAQHLQHPSHGKWKHYQVELDRPLAATDRQQLERGITLEDGVSRVHITGTRHRLEVLLQEGRNRQIRRSFAAAGYRVRRLHRIDFGALNIGTLAPGAWRELTATELEVLA